MSEAAFGNNKIVFNSIEWSQLPEKIISREGYEVEVSGDKWRLLIVGRSAYLNFSRIKNRRLAWALKAYVIDCIQRTSMDAGVNAFKSVLQYFLLGGDGFDHDEDPDFRFAYVLFIDKLLFRAKMDRTLHRHYRAIQWYLWCAENYPELGFCSIQAQELDALRTPAGPRGEAVHSEELTEGPLHRKLELPLIIDALKNDSSSLFSHVQERAAMALALAFGRNPLNLVYLWESDIEDLTPEAPERCYVIHMPRIKKRLLMPRDDRKTEHMASELARHVLALISRNRQFEVAVEIDGRKKYLNRPLFSARYPNQHFLEQKRYQDAFYITSLEITNLLAAFVRRHNIISPLTGEPLKITTRRLRYTLATNLAAEGISKRELATILDHTDTQYVQVYFDVAAQIVKQLDKAAAFRLSEYVSYFKGEFAGSKQSAENEGGKPVVFYNEVLPVKDEEIGQCGQLTLCHLDPPYSCYLCPKFRPYSDADHNFVLECLLSNRREMLKEPERSRLGIQLDDVIAAVAEVLKISGKVSE